MNRFPGLRAQVYRDVLVGRYMIKVRSEEGWIRCQMVWQGSPTKNWQGLCDAVWFAMRQAQKGWDNAR